MWRLVNMKGNDMFNPGTKIRAILYRGTDPEEVNQRLESYKHLIRTSPILTKGPGVDFEARLTEIILESSYTIIGLGVII